MTDKARCAESVYRAWGNGFGQSGFCQRAGVISEKGKMWCRQHAPSAQAERSKKSREAYDAKWRDEDRYKYIGKAAVKILREIAAGHNDPRALATAWLADFDK